jgi:hypothetical protein
VSPLDGVNGARRNLLARIGLSGGGAACPAREEAASVITRDQGKPPAARRCSKALMCV